MDDSHCRLLALQSEIPIVGYWRPPVPGWLKLNTDGSSLGNPGPSSYGGIIRDDGGAWVCGYVGNIGWDSTLGAELSGISMGLRLIRAMEFKKVVIETDSQAALLLLTVDGVHDSHPLKLLIEDCRRDLRELGCYMVHVKRDGNHCADRMAKIGGRQDRDFVFYDDAPPMLFRFLEEDAAGILFN
ncbi:hypothetical protein LXL04_036229 [Taraxacum kok-saghyz]